MIENSSIKRFLYGKNFFAGGIRIKAASASQYDYLRDVWAKLLIHTASGFYILLPCRPWYSILNNGMDRELEKHKQWFDEFAKTKIARARRDTHPLWLKLEHTWKVLENADAICSGEQLSELRLPALLGALYHDVARFDQYLTYGTFKDRESRNHGLMGVKILKREKPLDGLGPKTADIVRCAVAWHNRFSLPSGISESMAVVCNVVRDADKLDILRVMAEHLDGPGPYNPTVILSLPDDDSLHSAKVVADAMAGVTPSYGDLRSVNDFRVLLGAWFFGLNFSTSKNIFKERKEGQKLVEALPDNEFYGRVKERLLAAFEKGQKRRPA